MIYNVIISQSRSLYSQYGKAEAQEMKSLNTDGRKEPQQMSSLFGLVGKGNILNILNTLLYGKGNDGQPILDSNTGLSLDSNTGLSLDTLGKGNIL